MHPENAAKCFFHMKFEHRKLPLQSVESTLFQDLLLLATVHGQTWPPRVIIAD